MKLNCWCCLEKFHGFCKATRKEKKKCKEYHKKNNINPDPVYFSLNLGTIDIKKERGDKDGDIR